MDSLNIALLSMQLPSGITWLDVAFDSAILIVLLVGLVLEIWKQFH